MEREILLLSAGALISLISSIVTTIVSAAISQKTEKNRRDREQEETLFREAGKFVGKRSHLGGTSDDQISAFHDAIPSLLKELEHMRGRQDSDSIIAVLIGFLEGQNSNKDKI